MKLLFLLFFIVYFNSYGSEKFYLSYNRNPNVNFDHNLYQITREFEKLNYIRFTPVSNGKIPFIHADEILTSENSNDLIAIITNFDVDKKFLNQIFSLNYNNENFFVYHFNKTSIAFFNFSENKVKSILKLIMDNIPTTSKINLIDFFYSTANADCSINSNDKITPFQKISEHIINKNMQKKISECAIHSINSSKATLVDTFNFFDQNFQSPEKMWSEIKSNFLVLKNSIKTIQENSDKILSALKNLTPEQKMKFSCIIAGKFLANLALSLTGTGLVLASAKLMKTFVSKLKSIENLITTLNANHLPIENSMEALTCVL